MEELVRKAKEGDIQAFEMIIQKLKYELYKVAKSRLKNEDDIADVIQETILSAYQNMKKLKK